MSKERILVVEDQTDISSLLKIYFTSQGYEVFTATRGSVALELCRKVVPNLAVLDINLPDMEGYDIGKALRASPRTRHIPIIFLTARGERGDRLRGLGEVQAQYYIVKPFDIEEVHTIVRNQLEEARRKNQLHPVTNLPTADVINDQLRALLTTKNWGMALVHINGFGTFTQSYGSVVGEDVLKFTALLLNEAIYAEGASNEEFIGQMVVGPDFVMTSTPERIRTICRRLFERFDDEIGLHYNFKHRKQGFLEVPDDNGGTRRVPLMSLSIGVLTAADGPFYDIRELIDTAEETRQSALQRAREPGHRSVAAFSRNAANLLTTLEEEQLQLRRVVASADLTLLAVSVVYEVAATAERLLHEAAVLPATYRAFQLRPADMFMILPSAAVEATVAALTAQFYKHPIARAHSDAKLVLGWACGPYGTIDELLVAVGRDQLRRHDTLEVPAILYLEPKRKSEQEQYAHAQERNKELLALLHARGTPSEAELRIEVDRLLATSEHDVRNAASALQTTMIELRRMLPDEAHALRQQLMWLEQQVRLCFAWQRTLLELGSGPLNPNQPLKVGLLLKQQLRTMCRHLGLRLNLDLDELSDESEALIDRELLLCVTVHLLHTTHAVGAKQLRVSSVVDKEGKHRIHFELDRGRWEHFDQLAAGRFFESLRQAPAVLRPLLLVSRTLRLQQVKVVSERARLTWIIHPTDPQPLMLKTIPELTIDLEQVKAENQILRAQINAQGARPSLLLRKVSYSLIRPYLELFDIQLLSLCEQAAALTSSLAAQPEARLLAEHVCAQANFIQATLGQLKRAIRPPRIVLEQVELNTQIRSTLQLLQHKLSLKSVALALDPLLPSVETDVRSVQQILLGLLRNAADASQVTNTPVTIQTFGEPEHVVVEISDQGPGIVPEAARHLFELGYSTRLAGTAYGLGLYLANLNCRRIGAQLSFASASRKDERTLQAWGQDTDPKVWQHTGTFVRLRIPFCHLWKQ